MPATINRVVGTAFVVLGVALIAFGIFFGGFGWLNDGARAGLGLLLVPGAFGAAAIAIGFTFYAVARVHASRSPWRWWLQAVIPILAIYLFFGVAAQLSAALEDVLR